MVPVCPSTLAAALLAALLSASSPYCYPPQAAHLAGALLPSQTLALPWWYDRCTCCSWRASWRLALLPAHWASSGQLEAAASSRGSACITHMHAAAAAAASAAAGGCPREPADQQRSQAWQTRHRERRLQRPEQQSSWEEELEQGWAGPSAKSQAEQAAAATSGRHTAAAALAAPAAPAAAGEEQAVFSTLAGAGAI